MPPPVYFALLYLTAVVAGTFGALLGLGGGVLLVPALTLAFGIDIRYAIGASIVSVVATSSGAAATYVKEDLTNLRLGMFLESATTTGALFGAFVAGLIGGPALFFIFALAMVYAAVMMLRRSRLPDAAAAVEPDAIARALRLAGRYEDRAAGRTVVYAVTGVPVGFLVSMLAGAVSGLLGIGGGAIKVPAMDLVMHVPLKAAVATSDLMIGVTAAASAGVYFARGDIDPFVAAPVAMGVVSGTVIGTRVMTRLSGARLRLIFALVLALVAVQMMLRGLGVD
jgi:uncharacterized membrane protein YfcA